MYIKKKKDVEENASTANGKQGGEEEVKENEE